MTNSAQPEISKPNPIIIDWQNCNNTEGEFVKLNIQGAMREKVIFWRGLFESILKLIGLKIIYH